MAPLEYVFHRVEDQREIAGLPMIQTAGPSTTPQLP